jgi:hypothetical protein
MTDTSFATIKFDTIEWMNGQTAVFKKVLINAYDGDTMNHQMKVQWPTAVPISRSVDCVLIEDTTYNLWLKLYHENITKYDETPFGELQGWHWVLKNGFKTLLWVRPSDKTVIVE